MKVPNLMTRLDFKGSRVMWRVIVLANIAVAVAIIIVGALAMQVRLDAVRAQVQQTAANAAERWLEQTQGMDDGGRVNALRVDQGPRSADYAFFEGAMTGTGVVALEFHDVDSAQSLMFVKNSVSQCRSRLERSFVVAGMNQDGALRMFVETSPGNCPTVLVIANRFLPEAAHVGTFLRIAVDTSDDYQVFLAEMQRTSRLAVLLAALGLGSTLLTAFVAWRLSRRDKRIRYIAGHDPLTGLSNRYSFHRELAQRFDEERDTLRATLLLMDLDGFKGVNDMLGHDHGDALLSRVGARLKAMLRAEDTVARLGGDEFAVVLWGDVKLELAQDIAGDVIDAVNAVDIVNGVPVSVGASVGIAAIPDHAQTVEELLRKADVALYHAKERGKGHARVFDEEMEAAQQTHYAIRHALKRAIRTNSVPVVFQPIHAAQTGELRGFEALARLQDDYGATFYPSEFIPIAEEMRMVDKFGAAVLRAACAEVAPLSDDLKVAVNISPNQVVWSLLDDVKEALALCGMHPTRLELEITESEEIWAAPAVAAIIRALRAEGVSIALDDFGCGYANLTYLWELPLDRVKIDRKVFGAAQTRPRAQAVVQRLGILGEGIGLKMTAEGIESDEQWSFALQSGYEEVQGYYFSQPMPGAELAAYAARSRGHFHAPASEFAEPAWPAMDQSRRH